MKNINYDCIAINGMAEKFRDNKDEENKLITKEGAMASVGILKSLPPRRGNRRTLRDAAIEILERFANDKIDKTHRLYMGQMHNALNSECKYLLVYDRVRGNDVMRSVMVFDTLEAVERKIKGSDNPVPVMLYERDEASGVVYLREWKQYVYSI